MSTRSDSVVSAAPAIPLAHAAGTLSSSNPQCLQALFSYQAPLVIFFVRHPDKEGTGLIATPHEINDLVKQIENHFTPLIEANSLLETSSSRTFISLEFGKAIDIYPSSNVAVLHIYIIAIDHKDIKPKKIAAIAKDWRDEISKNGDENHAMVLLYHPALLEVPDLDLILSQAAKQSFFPKKFAAVTSAAASAKLTVEEAAVLAHEFMEEIKKTKVGKAVYVYHPSDVMAKVADSLKLAYANRAVRLKVLRHQVQTSRNSPGWSIQEFWRRGYDVAIHHLRFGCLQEAMSSFMQLFTEFYNKSDDYGFIKEQDWDVLVRLGSLKNMFDPQRIVNSGHTSPFPGRGGSRNSRMGATAGSGHPGNYLTGYPPMLSDSAEIVDALVFIVGCEMYCAVLLDNKPGALARFDCFLEVAREKIAEEIQKETNPESKRTAIAISEFFFYRAYMSALDLCCNVAASLNGTSTISVARYARSQSNSAGTLTANTADADHHQQQQSSAPALVVAADPSIGNGGSSSLINNSNMTPEALSETRSAHSVGLESECVTTTCETLLGVEGALRFCGEEHLEPNSPYQKEREAFQISLGELCLSARNHFVTLGSACGLQLKSLASATALAARGRKGTHQRGASSSSAGSSPSATSLMVKSLPMIDELKTGEAFETNYVALTRIAASAFRSGKRHRHECVMLLELSQLLLKTHPARAAEIIRTQILPQLSASQWGYLHAYARKLYVECFEGITSTTDGGAIPSGVNETYEGCLECVFQLLHGLTDPHERHYYWEKLLSFESRLKKMDSDDVVDAFPLTALLRSKPRLCIRRTPVVGTELATPNAAVSHTQSVVKESSVLSTTKPGDRNVPLGTNGDFVVLSANIDEMVYLRMTASCPVDIQLDDQHRPRHQMSSTDGAAAAESNTLLTLSHERLIRIEATLESKKNWLAVDEPTHLVKLEKFSVVGYNEADQTLDLAMPLVPCHAGEYRLRTLALHIGCIQLRTSWVDQAKPFILLIPEPDIGIEFTVDPVKELHCFADTEDFCTASVVIKKPLDVDDPDEDSEKSAAMLGQSCAFEGADESPVMDMLSSGLALREASAMGTTQSAISLVYNKLSLQDERDGAIVGRVLVGKPSAAAAAGGGSGRHRGLSSTMVTPKRGEGGFAPSFFGEIASRSPDLDPSAATANNSFTASSNILLSNDSLVANGSGPALAEYRRSVSSRRPRGLSIFDEAGGKSMPMGGGHAHAGDKLYDFEDKFSGTGEKTTVPSSFERKLMKVPDAASDHEVSLGVVASILHNGVTSFSLRLSDESVATKEALLRATTLRLKIPLMPSFMQGDKTHFSFCCKRDRDVVVQDTRASIKFRHALACVYAFKAFQGRVHCLVTIENILPASALLIHSLRLELVDDDAAYMVTRSARSNRSALRRAFTPAERLALFFELTPSPTFHSTRGVATHRVQLVVCYSKWTENSAQELLKSEASGSMTIPSILPVTSNLSDVEVLRSQQSSPTSRSPVVNGRGVLPAATLRNIPVVASASNSRSTTPEIGCVTPQHQQHHHHSNLGITNSMLSYSSMAKKVPIPEVMMHSEHEWREFSLLHNIYRAPIGSFESRHHCLFNVMVLLAEGAPSHDDGDDGTGGAESFPDLLTIAPSTVFSPLASAAAVQKGSRRWGLEGRVFPIGEPVFFDIILEPQATNWPEIDDDEGFDSSTATAEPTEHRHHHHRAGIEDQFFVKIVVDPTQWMVLGRSVELRTLSRWEDHRCRFAAVPIAAASESIKLPAVATASGGGGSHVHHDSMSSLAVVDTPTVIVNRAMFTSSSVTPGEVVPVDVVLCRAQLHLRR